MLTVRVLDRWEDVQGLGDRWDPLLSASATDTVFLTWEWVSSWWHAYGGDRSPRVISFERDGALIAIAPLCSRRISRFAVIRYEAMGFLGDGTADSDYLDLIVRRGEEEEVADRLVTLLTTMDVPMVTFLNEIPMSSPTVVPLRRALERHGWTSRVEPVVCAETHLPDTWDRYLRMLQPRMRTKIRSLTRRLAEAHHVSFRYVESMEELAANLESLFQLHQRRWEREGKPGAFAAPPKRRFYEEFSERFLARGWLRLSTLEVDRSPVAHQMCFEYGRTMFLLQEGFDLEWESKGIGNVLRAHVFRDCVERGVRTYDFLGGMTEHKRSWGATPKQSLRITAAAPRTPLWLLADVPRFLDRVAARVGAGVRARNGSTGHGAGAGVVSLGGVSGQEETA